MERLPVHVILLFTVQFAEHVHSNHFTNQWIQKA